MQDITDPKCGLMPKKLQECKTLEVKANIEPLTLLVQNKMSILESSLNGQEQLQAGKIDEGKGITEGSGKDEGDEVV